MNARACVEDELAAVETIDELHPALCRMVDGYSQMFLADPAMYKIWYATRSDKDKALLATASHLIMKLATDAVRHAITLEKPEGEQSIALFKQMLPKDPHTLG